MTADDGACGDACGDERSRAASNGTTPIAAHGILRTMRLLALPSSALLLCSLCSCGGAQTKEASATPEEGGPAGLETPETRCLAIARGSRQRQAGEPEKIVVKHVLVKFAGAKSAKPEVKRTRGEACLRALEARSQLQNGETFGAVVAAYSEEPGAASREGSIGSIKRGDVVPTFADAAFELKPGDVSHVVETDFGYHIIMRTE